MREWRARLAASAALLLAAACTGPPQGQGPFVAPLGGAAEPIRLADLARTGAAPDRAPSGAPIANRSANARLKARGPNSAARIALVWRSDCAPCVAELHYFDRLERAAGAGRLVTIALEPADKARATLARLGVKPHPAYAAVGEPEDFLETLSGGRRLPLAIALDGDGAVCARHVGLLGIERARAWSARC